MCTQAKANARLWAFQAKYAADFARDSTSGLGDPAEVAFRATSLRHAPLHVIRHNKSVHVSLLYHDIENRQGHGACCAVPLYMMCCPEVRFWYKASCSAVADGKPGIIMYMSWQ